MVETERGREERRVFQQDIGRLKKKEYKKWEELKMVVTETATKILGMTLGRGIERHGGGLKKYEQQ